MGLSFRFRDEGYEGRIVAYELSLKVSSPPYHPTVETEDCHISCTLPPPAPLSSPTAPHSLSAGTVFHEIETVSFCPKLGNTLVRVYLSQSQLVQTTQTLESLVETLHIKDTSSVC
jgi:hypothetical protein